MKSQVFASIMMALVMGTASCGSDESANGWGDADMIAEPPVEPGTETPDGGLPDAARDPDAAEEAQEAPGGDEIVDLSQDEATIPDARWLCSGENPDRIGGCCNGSEACDDDAFTVTDDRLGPLVLACYADDPSLGHGIAYISLNTGPQCDTLPTCSGLVNERPRCQGWEKCECENAWDAGNIQYASDGQGVIKILECMPEGTMRDVDLSAYAGQSLWVGSHTQPDGTGRRAESCLVKKTW